MMKPDIKRRWVKALLSGKYTQGKGKLRSNDDEFCCLGVLCDLAEQDGVKMRVNETERDGFRYDGSRGVPPESVAKWAGMSNACPNVDIPGVSYPTPLWMLNDGLGAVSPALTFAEIAKVIEEQL